MSQVVRIELSSTIQLIRVSDIGQRHIDDEEPLADGRRSMGVALEVCGGSVDIEMVHTPHCGPGACLTLG